MYSSCVYVFGMHLLIYILSVNVRVTHLFHFQYFFLNIFQNKFYIESKLNRDLREELMKLFADHVAEKHVNTLMRECTPSVEGPGVCLEYRK